MATGSGWKTGLTMVLGVWLAVSPWLVLPAPLASSVDAWVAGAAILLVATVSLRSRRPEEFQWFNVMLGVWVFLAPWALDFAGSAGAAWNGWIVGAAVAVLSLWSSSEVSARRRALERQRGRG